MNNKKKDTIKSSKLLKLLLLLTANEFKSLKKWLDSPWCNSNKKLLKFYLILEKHGGDFGTMNYDKATLFKKLYPGKIFNNAILNNLIHAFTRQIESFIVHQKIEKDKAEKEWILREAYQVRNESKAFFETSKKLIKQYEQCSIKTNQVYLRLGLLYEQLYFQPNENIHYRKDQNALEFAGQYLDMFYALSHFRILNELMQRKVILKTKIKSFPPPQQLAWLKNQVQHPIIDLYHLRLKRKKNWGLEDYFEFKQLYLNYYEKLGNEEKESMYTSAMNDIVFLCHTGNIEAYSEMLNLTQIGLEYGLILQDGRITNTRFINFVQIATVLKEERFVSKIISDYLPLLEQEYQKEARKWSEAQIKYCYGSTEVCIDLIIQYNFTNPIYAIVSRVTLLKAHFDLLLLEKIPLKYFLPHCGAFEQYMRRNEFIQTEKAMAFIRLIQYTRRAATLISNKDQEAKHTKNKLKKIKTLVNKEKQMIGKLWLFERLDEILADEKYWT